MAASVGRRDLIAACFDANGELIRTAKENRAPYRPHSGFPEWKPSSDSHEVLDKALVWAGVASLVNMMGVRASVAAGGGGATGSSA